MGNFGTIRARFVLLFYNNVTEAFMITEKIQTLFEIINCPTKFKGIKK